MQSDGLEHYVYEHTFILENNVTEIQPELFKYYYQVKKVEFPPSLTSLSESCFLFCMVIKEIILPSTLKILPDYCFSHCISLAKITIPSNVISIGKECFYHCSKIKTFSIPSTVTQIGDRCFANCGSLRTIEFDKSIQLKSIPKYCFSNCKFLTQIKGIENIKEFQKGCFYNTPRLQFISKKIFEETETKRMHFITKYQHQFEQMTKRKIGNILFDTNIDNWQLMTSTFDKDILNHSNLLILIINEEKDIFGYYTSNYSISTINEMNKMGKECYFFSLRNKRRNSKLNKIIKYQQNEQSNIIVFDEKEICLLNICDTIIINKYLTNSYSEFYLNKKLFTFDLKHPLSFEDNFIVKRLLIIEMIE